MITYEMNLFKASEYSGSRLIELIRLVQVASADKRMIGMHQHEDFCEWEYIESGCAHYIIDSVPYEVHAGDLICINRNVAHSEYSDSENPMSSWKICCRMSPMDDLDANQIIPSDICPVIHTGELGIEISSCFQKLSQELSEKRANYKSIAVIMTEYSYILLARAISEFGLQVQMPDLSLAMRTKQYIDLHYSEKITLDLLAARLHASKYYISHEMKEAYNCSPIDYLIRVRLGEAQNLLNTTGLSIGEIARKVGYDNISYFNNSFARKTGVTPSQFRDRNLRMFN